MIKNSKIGLKIILVLFILMGLIGCKSIESGFYIESIKIDKTTLKPNEEVNLEVDIAKKTGRQQIQHTANMKVQVVSNNPDIEIIPTPTTDAEEVQGSSINVVARAGGVLPRPFKFKIKVNNNCKPGQYVITVKSKVNDEEDLKIININVEGG